MTAAPWLQPLIDSLMARAQRDALPHALLLLGPPAAGAWLGQRLVQCLLCDVGTGCESCRSCMLLAAGTHPDFLLCQAESKSGQIKIDQIRILIERSSLTGSMTKRRIFLIDGADWMNTAAANALLKTLEEPPPGTLLLLTAAQRSSLPATVMSRCQVYPLPAAGAQGRSWLAGERPDLDAAQIDELLAIAGDPFEVIGLLERLGDTDLKALSEPLGPLVARVTSGQVDIAQLAAHWTDGLAALRLARLARLWHALISARLNFGASRNVALEELSNLTQGMDLASLLQCYEQTNECRRLLTTPVRMELQIESLLVGWQQLASAHN